ncbi:penicillin-binding transpeptidase domain-containing protein [Streptomyces sp. NPDC057011]|uniref:penicillin-binding transpeptidase domain-containing protein n=1 Tax=unclassified Streptomyces TaxID=2593676 RepID=UPI0036420241
MRCGVKRIFVGSAIATVFTVTGIGVYNVGTALGAWGPHSARPAVSEAVADETVHAFLDMWSSGNIEAASGLTNDPGAAALAMRSFRRDAQVEQVKFNTGPREGDFLPVRVRATVRSGKRKAVWEYDSRLKVVLGRRTGAPLVDWSPAVVHPRLGKGQKLKAKPAGSARFESQDRQGQPMTKEQYPGLAAVLDQLRARYAGETGISVWAEGPGGTDAVPLFEPGGGKPVTVRTTLDAGVQRAAEEAVRGRPGASVVALKPSTGEILAMANSGGGEFNAAAQGRQAPGSTFKIVTAAALLEAGLVTPDQAAGCPAVATVSGRAFRNAHGGDLPGATLKEAFAMSCNTTFVALNDRLDTDTLPSLARDVFGIGKDWKVGIPTADGSVAAPDGPGEKAATAIGQGTVQMNALNVASIAATVQHGSFKQPVLVPVGDEPRQLATARPLDDGVARGLRDMMRHTAQSGTAAPALTGMDGDVGAKTGTAEVDGAANNGWFTAYRNDIAAAAVVRGGETGASSAGPIVAAVLRAAS